MQVLLIILFYFRFNWNARLGSKVLVWSSSRLGMSDVNCKAFVMPNEEDESSVRAPKELSCFEDLHILSAVRRIAVCPIMMITCG